MFDISKIFGHWTGWVAKAKDYKKVIINKVNASIKEKIFAYVFNIEDMSNMSPSDTRNIAGGLLVQMSGVDKDGKLKLTKKDLHTVVIKNFINSSSEDPERGGAALILNTTQVGNGVANFESYLVNPGWADEQASHMQHVFNITPEKGSWNDDGGKRHYNPVTAQNPTENEARAAFRVFGKFAFGLDLLEADCGKWGIRMGNSPAGKRIFYAPGCYTDFRNGKFIFVVDNKIVAKIGKNGVE